MPKVNIDAEELRGISDAHSEKLLNIIFRRIEQTNKPEAYMDALAVLQEHYDEKRLSELRKKAVISMQKKGKNDEGYYDAYKLALLISAPHNFDSFMQYLEIDRKPEARFYLPRRKQLYPVVAALQKLADSEIMELFLSCPPRIGKTSLMLMFMAWCMGRDTEYPNLYCSHSDTLTMSFYNGLLEILTDEDTYNYGRIFPKVKIVRQNAADEIIDLNRKKHYPTFTARSLTGTLNGSCDAERGIIIADDLLGGIDEAKSPDRLKSAWDRVEGNLIPRGKEATRFVWMGTRWSISDPSGMRLETLQEDRTFDGYPYAYINIPALNEKDESNFDYKYNVGFSTTYYKRRRASLERHGDMATWNAVYMGIPTEREGMAFASDQMRYFDGTLPDKIDPDRIFTFVDPAWGGGDYVAAPICVMYGNTIYVPDVVYNNSDKSVTQPLVAEKIEKYGVQACRIEGTKTTASYAEGISDILKRDNYHCNMQVSSKHWTGTGKQDRIQDKASDIKENMVFLESGKRSKEYDMFMQNLFSFKLVGKNKNDDAPDSLAGAVSMAFERQARKASIRKRPF